MVAQSTLVESSAGVDRPSRAVRLNTLLRRNWLFVALVIVGVGLRVIAWLAYQPALLYTDSYYYLDNVAALDPQYLDPIGYSLFVLKPLLALDGLQLVSAVQHLAGIGMALLLYRVALRCGVRRWLAALGTAPVLLDGYQNQIEQNVLTDVWLQVLLVLVLWLLLGRRTPRAWMFGVAGLAIGLAMSVRMVAITLIVPVAIYALLAGRQWRVPGGWRRIAARFGALVGCFAIVVVAYAGYFDAKAGYWGLSNSSGNSLYGRTAVVADCAKLDLDKVLAQLCPPQPVGQRASSNDLAHSDGDPKWPGYVPPGETKYDLERQFADRVIEKQPLDVAAAILKDFGKGFLPVHSTLHGDPPSELWDFHPDFPTFTRDPNDHTTNPYTQTNAEAVEYGGKGLSLNRGLATFLDHYQDFGYTPGPLLAALGVLGLLGGFGVGRARRSGLCAATLLTTGLAITVLGTAAVFEFSWRYQLPGLVLLPLAGILGITALTSRRRPDPAASADGPAADGPSTGPDTGPDTGPVDGTAAEPVRDPGGEGGADPGAEPAGEPAADPVGAGESVRSDRTG
jgi:hypothetical protein